MGDTRRSQTFRTALTTTNSNNRGKGSSESSDDGLLSCKGFSELGSSAKLRHHSSALLGRRRESRSASDAGGDKEKLEGFILDGTEQKQKKRVGKMVVEWSRAFLPSSCSGLLAALNMAPFTLVRILCLHRNGFPGKNSRCSNHQSWFTDTTDPPTKKRTHKQQSNTKK
jgi:hypothetical protein